jgi:MoaA/NifB/PqqE/SkfB family radical SAM enzyme
MKIIKVKPATPMIALTWMISTRCNYDCMYCPTAWHDSTSKHPDLDNLKQVWDNFYENTRAQQQPYKVSFTGGEVTANRSFLPLVEYIRNGNFNIGQLLVTTNGSASEKYYTKLAASVDAISFSTHSEFFDEQEFFNKVEKINAIMVRPQKSVHVNIMDESWNQHRIPVYQSWLTQRGISHSVNTVDYTNQIRSMPVQQGVTNLVN